MPACLWLALASSSFGACDPQDEAFFLDRGYTQEQVAKLCAYTDPGIPEYTPYQPPAPVIARPVLRTPAGGPERGRGAARVTEMAAMDLSAFTDAEKSAVQTLVAGADVIALAVDAESIQYTKQACLEVREDPDFPAQLALCPEVDYRILREGLAVGKYGREFGMFGKATVTLEGAIQRFPRQNFADYPRKYQQKLKPHFNWQTQSRSTRIAVRGGHTATQLAGAIRTLARAVRTDTARAEKTREKKKRWWNPFD